MHRPDLHSWSAVKMYRLSVFRINKCFYTLHLVGLISPVVTSIGCQGDGSESSLPLRLLLFRQIKALASELLLLELFQTGGESLDLPH